MEGLDPLLMNTICLVLLKTIYSFVRGFVVKFAVEGDFAGSLDP